MSESGIKFFLKETHRNLSFMFMGDTTLLNSGAHPILSKISFTEVISDLLLGGEVNNTRSSGISPTRVYYV